MVPILFHANPKRDIARLCAFRLGANPTPWIDIGPSRNQYHDIDVLYRTSERLESIIDVRIRVLECADQDVDVRFKVQREPITRHR